MASLSSLLEITDTYNMTHERRGQAVIIDNHGGQSGGRGVTDQIKMEECLVYLGFDVTVYTNLKRKQMTNLMIKVSKYDHSNSDCFACVIMSKGVNDTVMGTDGLLTLNKLIAPLNGNVCKSLAGKPKLFFVQSYRKVKRPPVHAKDCVDVVDGQVGLGDKYSIPTEANFLIASCTEIGYESRQQTESYFINTLCTVLKQYSMTLDLLRIMIRVNKMVAFTVASEGRDLDFGNQILVPSLVSMLTKDVFFHSKNLKTIHQ